MKTYFESVYSENYRSLVKLASSYVGNIMEAEDIVQDVFMHLWIRINIGCDFSMNSIEEVNYVIVSVKNRCLDHLRTKSRLKKLCYDDNKIDINLVTDPVDFLVTEEEKLGVEKDVENRISNAINNLPSKCRQIFIEKRIHGEKQLNIASKHNISVKTIEKQMNIAYKKLRVELSCLV